MSTLISRGVSKMTVDWLDLFESEHFVNDDAAALIESWLEAEQIDPDNSRHSAMLGDGLVMLEAVTSDGQTNLSIVYTPYLNNAFSEQRCVVLDGRAYRFAWADLVWQLIEAADDSPAGPPASR